MNSYTCKQLIWKVLLDVTISISNIVYTLMDK